MPGGQINLVLTAAIGSKGNKIAVRRKGRLFIASGAETHLTLNARHHILHKDAMPLRGQTGKGHQGSVRAECGFRVIAAVHADTAHLPGREVFEENLRPAHPSGSKGHFRTGGIEGR